MEQRNLIVGISGASGAPIAVGLLHALQHISDIKTHLIITKSAEQTIKQETNLTVSDICALADIIYDEKNIGAGPASGSFKTMGMIIVPCSMKTVAGIHSGYSDNLLLRAADVTLKEHRKLVLVPRECPLGTIHLRNLYELSQFGAIILPPVLSFYNRPETIDDAVNHIIGKVLDCFDLSFSAYKRWK